VGDLNTTHQQESHLTRNKETSEVSTTDQMALTDT
jgi:hypothetical protein